MSGDGLLRIGCLMAVGLLTAAILGPLCAPYDPTAVVAAQLAEPMPPGAPFYLGTDDLGRDVLSRLLYGARSGLELLYMNDKRDDFSLYYDEESFEAFQALSPRPNWADPIAWDHAIEERSR